MSMRNDNVACRLLQGGLLCECKNSRVLISLVGCTQHFGPRQGGTSLCSDPFLVHAPFFPRLMLTESALRVLFPILFPHNLSARFDPSLGQNVRGFLLNAMVRIGSIVDLILFGSKSKGKSILAGTDRPPGCIGGCSAADEPISGPIF